MIVAFFALAALPSVVEPLDEPHVAQDPGGPELRISRLVAQGTDCPSPVATAFAVPVLKEGERARAWVATIGRSALKGMDGLSFHLKGSGTGEDVTLVLRVGDGETKRDYVSDALLRSPLWHRVYLPFSEFYDPTTKGHYPVARLPRDGDGDVAVGVEIAGPTNQPMTFALDGLGFSTSVEVARSLGWKTYMPPSHGFPPFVERFDGPLRWSVTKRARVRPVPLAGFPCEGFVHGLSVALPAPDSAASMVLEPHEALPLYEGIGFWVKGDGRDHTIAITCAGDDGIPYVFTTPVRGRDWKLVFAGFENFKHEGHELEVEEAGSVRLSISLHPSSPPPATLMLGPFRLGYEK